MATLVGVICADESYRRFNRHEVECLDMWSSSLIQMQKLLRQKKEPVLNVKEYACLVALRQVTKIEATGRI